MTLIATILSIPSPVIAGYLAILMIMVFIAGIKTVIQDQIAFLGKQVSEESIEQEVSIRMLKHIASSVRHQQFHNTDVITIRVEAIKRAASGNLI